MKIVYKHFRFMKPNQMVKGLRHLGRHGFAWHYQRGETDWTPEERGGYTVCYVYSDEKNVLVIQAVAECSPLDPFCYRIGRDIARGRALKALNA